MLVDVVPGRVPGERQHRVPGDAQRVWGVTIPDKLIKTKTLKEAILSQKLLP